MCFLKSGTIDIECVSACVDKVIPTDTQNMLAVYWGALEQHWREQQCFFIPLGGKAERGQTGLPMSTLRSSEQKHCWCPKVLPTQNIYQDAKQTVFQEKMTKSTAVTGHWYQEEFIHVRQGYVVPLPWAGQGTPSVCDFACPKFTQDRFSLTFVYMNLPLFLVCFFSENHICSL